MRTTLKTIILGLSCLSLSSSVATSWAKAVVGQAIHQTEVNSQTLAKNACQVQQTELQKACPGKFAPTGCTFARCVQLASLWQCTSNGQGSCSVESALPGVPGSGPDDTASDPNIFNPLDDFERAIDNLPANQIVQEKCFIFPSTDPADLRKLINDSDGHGRYYSAQFSYKVRQKIIVILQTTERASQTEIIRTLPVVVGFGDGGSRNQEVVFKHLVSYSQARLPFICQ
ncbi:MAG: hypothetical protein NTV34_19090 [Proteobacteria bacterium]|nr:hypothetical protein [Pseudomonadota bacterium]